MCYNFPRVSEQTDKLHDSALSYAKEKTIKSLIGELESIKGVTNKSEAFDFSSDEKVEKYIPKIVEFVKKPTTSLKAALIISHGALWNIPKELEGIDLVLRIDINETQLEYDKKRREKILNSLNLLDLLPKSNKKLNKNDVVAVRREMFRLKEPEVEKISYGPYHYLSSFGMLEKTKLFLNKNNIAFIGGDLSDLEFTQKIGDVLKKHEAQVVFADLTNVMGWFGSIGNPQKKQEYINSLQKLPFCEKSPILHSIHLGMTGRSPLLSYLCMGLNEYKDFHLKVN